MVSRGKSGAQLGCGEQVGVLEGDGGGGHPREHVVGGGAMGDRGVSRPDVRVARGDAAAWSDGVCVCVCMCVYVCVCEV